MMPPRKILGKKSHTQIIIYPETGVKNGKKNLKRKSSRLQTGGFLNRYDFAYAGRDIVNQAAKVAPK